ncbi:MAG: PQQ-binding-like beta-propeller repeat protein [Acidimicrobiales bacterium]
MSWWPISGRWRVPSMLTAALLVLLAMALGALAAYTAYSATATTVPGGVTHGHDRTSGTSGVRGSGVRGSGGGSAAGTPSTSSTPGTTGSATTTASWTVYGGAPDGRGVSGASVRLSSPRRAWRSPALDGQIFGQPLVVGSRVVVATENDTVYAMAAHDGSVLWSRHVGSPVAAGTLPCGDISPTVGITGTPVVDASRGEVFVVADERSGRGSAHHLVGLDLASGAVRLDQPVDPPGASPADLLQRTGLALDRGNVVFGYGGNYGDCGTYHGWVVAVPEGGGTPARFEVDARAGDHQGAIWMGGAAPEIDPAGNVWVAAGNGSVTSASGRYGGGDSVDELSPGLRLEHFFAPSNWRTDNADDHDLGSTAPALLADGDVFQVGKAQTGYLLRASHLGGIGGQRASAHVCTADADGGDAVRGKTVYVGCRSGVEAVHTGARTLSVRWTATSAATGPPIVAGGLIWSIGGGSLYGLSPRTGAAQVRLSVGSEADHFAVPSVGGGLLLAPGAGGDRVLAYAGSDGVPAAQGGRSSTTSS